MCNSASERKRYKDEQNPNQFSSNRASLFGAKSTSNKIQYLSKLQNEQSTQDAVYIINDREPAEIQKEANCGTLKYGFVFSLVKGKKKGTLENIRKLCSLLKGVKVKRIRKFQ